MTEYEFDLRFLLPSDSPNPLDHIDQLAKNGCDDALVGVGETGTIALSFLRKAKSRQEAIDGAIDDVKKAIPGSILRDSIEDI